MRHRVLAGLVLSVLVAGTATAGGRFPAVSGDYTYQYNDGTSHVQVVAFEGRSGTTGWMTFHGTYTDIAGPVTCVTVKGSDAWLAGVIESGEGFGLDGWMARIVDHGARDQAMTFIEEYALATAWCEGASTEYDADYLQALAAGWIIVR